jgi:hypothetical protein
MAQSAVAGVLNRSGVPDFGIIHIDTIEVAKVFQAYVESGSKLTGVSIEDIDTSVISLPSDQSEVTLVELLKLGMKLFDAVVWLTSDRQGEFKLQLSDSLKAEQIPSLQAISKSLFFVYFFLLTQARYPASGKAKEAPAVPNFLKTIMGLDQPQHFYTEMLCSFNITQFDPKWAQHISFKGLGQETLSRFGLGVAGYRMFGPFKVYSHIEGLDAKLIAAYNFARNVSMAPATWDIHPLTRNPNILTTRGNLNKNLGNLILDVFSEEQIDEMVSSKMLFKKPDREATMKNYLTWSAVDDISGKTEIFRSS